MELKLIQSNQVNCLSLRREKKQINTQEKTFWSRGKKKQLTNSTPLLLSMELKLGHIRGN